MRLVCLSNLPAPDSQCWKLTGMWGTQSCPTLEDVRHCKRCAVFVAAAGRLWRREPAASPKVEAAPAASEPELIAAADSRTVLLFRVHDAWFALPASVLVEAVERRAVHGVPDARSKVFKGIVNVRGELLVCMSLSRLFELEPGLARAQPQHVVFERLLVMRHAEVRLVVPVTEVFGLHKLPDEVLRPTPATTAAPALECAAGILAWHGPARLGYGDMELRVTVLDPSRLFRLLLSHLG